MLSFDQKPSPIRLRLLRSPTTGLRGYEMERVRELARIVKSAKADLLAVQTAAHRIALGQVLRNADDELRDLLQRGTLYVCPDGRETGFDGALEAWQS